MDGHPQFNTIATHTGAVLCFCGLFCGYVHISTADFYALLAIKAGVN
jgi:hypothetical protein